MAKYQKTLDLWDPEVSDKLYSGELKLQSGQWVTCGPDGIKSRFVKANSHHITVIHGGSSMEVCEKYKKYVKIHKKVVDSCK